MIEYDWKEYGIEIPYNAKIREDGEVETLCPKCSKDRKKSTQKCLSINTINGTFYCHHCEFSGRAKPIKEEHEPMSIIDSGEKKYTTPTNIGTQEYSSDFIYWFKDKRGISIETLKKAGVAEGDQWFPQLNSKKHCIMFHYYYGEKLVNTKFRTFPEKNFTLVGKARLIPYNINGIKGKDTCYIVEGEGDVLALMECGIDNVVSVPNGSQPNSDFLNDFLEDYFDDKQTIIIAGDADAKGKVMKDEMIRKFGAHRCKLVEWSWGCKDANDELVRHGKESVIRCLEHAKPPKIEGVIELSDFATDLDQMYTTGLLPGVKLGYERFDKLISFETKRLCVITGYPTSGKTEFINEMCVRLNIYHDWKWAMFSPESFPPHVHAANLIEKLVGKHFASKPTNNFTEHINFAEYVQAKRYADENFFWVYPDHPTIDNILTATLALVKMKGIKGLVIDPYNRLENDMGNTSETQYISKVLDKLTLFAQQNDILIVLMCHPAKPQKDKDGSVARPTMYDISGSAHFFNKADFGMVVARDKEKACTYVYVDKVKFRHLGEPGMGTFKFLPPNGRFVECTFDNTGAASFFCDTSNRIDEKKAMSTKDKPIQSEIDSSGEDEAFLLPESKEELPF